MDKSDFDEFKEFQAWKKEKDKKQPKRYLHSTNPKVALIIGVVIIVGAFVLSAIKIDGKKDNNNTQETTLSQAEKFLIGEWRIYDIGFTDSLWESGSKAYLTDERLTMLWEMAQNYCFVFDGAYTKYGNDKFLFASANTTANGAVIINDNGEIDKNSLPNYNVSAKCTLNDKTPFQFYFTHDYTDNSAYKNLQTRNESVLYFENYYYYNDTGYGDECAPINSIVHGYHGERDILEFRLIPYKDTDRIVWYRFVKM